MWAAQQVAANTLAKWLLGEMMCKKVWIFLFIIKIAEKHFSMLPQIAIIVVIVFNSDLRVRTSIQQHQPWAIFNCRLNSRIDCLNSISARFFFTHSENSNSHGRGKWARMKHFLLLFRKKKIARLCVLPANNSTIHEMLKSAWKIVDSFLQSWREVFGCLRCHPQKTLDDMTTLSWDMCWKKVHSLCGMSLIECATSEWMDCKFSFVFMTIYGWMFFFAAIEWKSFMSCDAMTQNSLFSVEIALCHGKLRMGSFYDLEKCSLVSAAHPFPVFSVFSISLHHKVSLTTLRNSLKFSSSSSSCCSNWSEISNLEKCFSHRNTESVVAATSSNSTQEQKCGSSR